MSDVSATHQSATGQSTTGQSAEIQQFEDVAASRAHIGRSVVRMFALLGRKELARWRGVFVMALVFTITAKVLSVAAPVFLGDGINSITGDGEGGGDAAAQLFIWAFVAYAGGRFLAQALPQMRDMLFVNVIQDAMRLVAVEAYGHAQRLPLQFHLTRRAGAVNRIIERGSGAMDYLIRFLGFNIIPTLIELALAAVVLATRYNWLFALAAVVTVFFYAMATIFITEVRTKQRRKLNEADTELKARSMDSLANFEIVKAFGAEARETENFNRALTSYNRLFVKLMRSLNVLNITQELVMNIGLLAFALIAGFAAVDGDLSAGDITAVILILMNIYRPLNILGWAWREIRQGIVDSEKLFGLLEVEATIDDAPNAQALQPRGGSVRFEDVSFTHEGRQSGLQGLSLDIAPGSYVGIVGPSGAGKSTILKLLFRFYDTSAGRVFVDGQDVRDVKQDSLRQCMGLVPQDVVLFNDTLRYNMAYGRPDATDAEILAVAKQARLDGFIASLPDGLDTRVGERGLKLSGGEKQRVGVARVMLRDPHILVLDEATSALDTATERDVQKALNEAAQGRTTIAVAHRLSTVAHADQIIVLDDGHVAEQGSHEELLTAGGLYAELWAKQAKA